jgi:hypothetical protein
MEHPPERMPAILLSYRRLGCTQKTWAAPENLGSRTPSTRRVVFWNKYSRICGQAERFPSGPSPLYPGRPAVRGWGGGGGWGVGTQPPSTLTSMQSTDVVSRGEAIIAFPDIYFPTSSSDG